MDDEKLLCPLRNIDCIKARCAWWDIEEDLCGMLSAVHELDRLNETLWEIIRKV